MMRCILRQLILASSPCLSSTTEAGFSGRLQACEVPKIAQGFASRAACQTWEPRADAPLDKTRQRQQGARMSHAFAQLPLGPRPIHIQQGFMPSFGSQGQLRGMFIQTQNTPNPQSQMFLPGKTVMESGVVSFSSAREAMVSPLAKRIFGIDGVTGVFFGADFITVTKKEEVPWAALKPLVFAAVMDHYSSGEPLLEDKEVQARSDTTIHEDDDEVVAMIKELLETRIRPAVAEDGGDITFKEFDVDSGIVMVKLSGSCSGCPSSTITLKSGIENMLMHYIPEVKGVMEAPPDETEEEGMKEFERFDAQVEGKGSSKEDGVQKAAPHPMAQHLSS